MASFVTVVNRTSEDLEGTWNGRHHTLPPGPSAFPELEAAAFKRQNPIMGSEDPRTGKMLYKIGIKEKGDDISPLDHVEESVEKWDRSKLTGAKPSDVVAGDNGIYSVRDVATNLPADSNFVPNDN